MKEVRGESRNGAVFRTRSYELLYHLTCYGAGIAAALISFEVIGRLQGVPKINLLWECVGCSIGGLVKTALGYVLEQKAIGRFKAKEKH